MATTNTQLDNVLEDIHELEDFLHVLIPALEQQKLRPGEEVLRYAKEMKLKIPRSIEGLEIIWEPDSAEAPQGRQTESVVLVRPGHPDALGLTLGCVGIGKWKVCLECSWIFCRIVVTRRF
jgi:hypothetical protein